MAVQKVLMLMCTMLCMCGAEDLDVQDPHKAPDKDWTPEEKAEMQKELKKIFKVLDRNKDKKLSLKEIKKHLNKVS